MMKTTFRLLSKYIFLSLIGGFIYMGIEILWRGKTHWTMGFLGGICFIEIGLINEIIPWSMDLVQQALIGAALVTINEFIAGLILNIYIGLAVWDYSNMPFNIMGQICLPFCILWIIVSLFAIMLDDYLRYRFFHEEYPSYHIGEKVFSPFKKNNIDKKRGDG